MEWTWREFITNEASPQTDEMYVVSRGRGT